MVKKNKKIRHILRARIIAIYISQSNALIVLDSLLKLPYQESHKKAQLINYDKFIKYTHTINTYFKNYLK